MKILVTAGNTQTPIDRVRCLTNVFSGRTGTRIALEASARGHQVSLLTSHPEVVAELAEGRQLPGAAWRVEQYRTFEDLEKLMQTEITGGGFDAVIHVAAVSDYEVAGAYAPVVGTSFHQGDQTWSALQPPPSMAKIEEGKIKSSHQELWLRLTPTPKLIDRIRKPWGFRGILVKFKLEVGVNEKALLTVAEHSRVQSDADCLVANTLERMSEEAWILAKGSAPVKVPRPELARRLIELLPHLAEQ